MSSAGPAPSGSCPSGPVQRGSMSPARWTAAIPARLDNAHRIVETGRSGGWKNAANSRQPGRARASAEIAAGQDCGLRARNVSLTLYGLRRGVRAVEGARLESVCTLIAYRGFESLPLRHVCASSCLLS